MTQTVTPEAAGAFIDAQRIAPSPQGAEGAAKFATLALDGAAKAFATLAFEDEPSGYVAAKRRHAP